MSRDGSIKLVWGDGEHTFRLGVLQLRELQEKTKESGPHEVLLRLARATWRVDDVRETIRLGLIGGGMAPGAAHTLVVRYVEGRPWLESAHAAQDILFAAVIGPSGDPVGKAPPAEDAMKAKAASPSPASTETEPSWDSHPPMSMQ